jgi:hypothetical protein
LFEPGALAFVTKTGPFAWNGLFTFWLPFSIFGIWLIIVYPRLFKAIRMQRKVPEEGLQEPKYAELAADNRTVG